jgi:hypothetical protein
MALLATLIGMALTYAYLGFGTGTGEYGIDGGVSSFYDFVDDGYVEYAGGGGGGGGDDAYGGDDDAAAAYNGDDGGGGGGDDRYHNQNMYYGDDQWRNNNNNNGNDDDQVAAYDDECNADAAGDGSQRNLQYNDGGSRMDTGTCIRLGLGVAFLIVLGIIGRRRRMRTR